MDLKFKFGIKVELEEFLQTMENNKIHAIGMSGLLVNQPAGFERHLGRDGQKEGFKIPSILGGAALTKGFGDYCGSAPCVLRGPTFLFGKRFLLEGG